MLLSATCHSNKTTELLELLFDQDPLPEFGMFFRMMSFLTIIKLHYLNNRIFFLV